jgi:uncharacterized membrane protein (DUF373 family)
MGLSDPDTDESRLHRLTYDGLAGLEDALYIIVALVLIAAAVLVVVGTVSALVAAIRHGLGAVNTGILLLDRTLLLLIVAELMHSLRFVVLRQRIVVEPFLFVGLIAVVRRVLILTAELERQNFSGRALTNQLLQLGLLGFLALSLAISIFLVRRSGRTDYDPARAAT